MCCDFFLLPIQQLPSIVAEVKVAMPDTINEILYGKGKDKGVFKGDLEKCEKWLEPATSHDIKKKFGIECFEYALAILIDLTDGIETKSWWKKNIDEENYSQKHIFAWLISPNLPLK